MKKEDKDLILGILLSFTISIVALLLIVTKI